MAVTLKIVFWCATPCNLVEIYQCFEGNYCFHLERCSYYTMSYSTRQYFPNISAFNEIILIFFW